MRDVYAFDFYLKILNHEIYYLDTVAIIKRKETDEYLLIVNSVKTFLEKYPELEAYDSSCHKNVERDMICLNSNADSAISTTLYIVEREIFEKEAVGRCFFQKPYRVIWGTRGLYQHTIGKLWKD